MPFTKRNDEWAVFRDAFVYDEYIIRQKRKRIARKLKYIHAAAPDHGNWPLDTPEVPCLDYTKVNAMARGSSVENRVLHATSLVSDYSSYLAL
jgi:hypothetical protein